MDLGEEGEVTTDSLSKLQKKMITLIQQLDKESRKVAKLVSENPNTKREIKESSLAIRSLLSQMTTETMMTMLRTNKVDKTDGAATATLVQLEDKDCQAGGTVMKTTRDVATQTAVHAIVKDPVVTVDQIREVDSLEDFQIIKNFTWPEEVFRVKHVEAAPLSGDRDSELVIWEEGTGLGENRRAAPGVEGNDRRDRVPIPDHEEDRPGREQDREGKDIDQS